eukprot:snap_masked-scaffold_44-processed-gene-1.15-mRNA-1 protein AED:1.00 eAED:1.00 QI:0/0/0/0/1/1/2/0/65
MQEGSMNKILETRVKRTSRFSKFTQAMLLDNNLFAILKLYPQQFNQKKSCMDNKLYLLPNPMNLI